MIRFVLPVLLLTLSGAVAAQTAPPMPPTPPSPGSGSGWPTRQVTSPQETMEGAFNLGFDVGQKVATEMSRLRARITDLEKRCGDACRDEDKKP